MTRETWQFVNTFAPWFSAIGTIAAVVVSLYLASTKSKLRLRITAGHRILADLGTGRFPDYLLIQVINIGFRPAKITNLVWKIGFFKKKYAIQVLNANQYSNQLPIELSDGQEANYLIPFEGTADWLNQFSKDFVGHPVRLRLFTLRVQVSTSIGKTFSCSIEKNLRERIIEAASK